MSQSDWIILALIVFGFAFLMSVLVAIETLSNDGLVKIWTKLRRRKKDRG